MITHFTKKDLANKTSYLIKPNNPRTVIIFLLICIIIACSGTPLLPSTVTVDSKFKHLLLGRSIEYFEDSKGSLTFEDVRNPRKALPWLQTKELSPSFGFKKSAYWVRFTLNNPEAVDVNLLFQQACPLIDDMKLYIPEKASYRIIEVGDYKKFSERPIRHRTFVIPIVVKAKSSMSCYVRQQTTSSMRFDLSLSSPEEFNRQSSMEYYFLMIYYGVIGIMIIYNLVIFLFVRRVEYLLYVLFVLFFATFTMGQNGLAYEFLWPNHPWWANYGIPLILALTLFCYMLFVMVFLEMKDHSRPLYRCYQGIVIISAVVAVLCAILPYQRAMVISAAWAGLVAVVSFFSGFAMAFKKVRTAYFFTIAFFVFLPAASVYICMSFGLVPQTFFTINSWLIGLALQIVLLSFALGDRISTTSKALAILTAQLEEKVKERTIELEHALSKMSILNKELVIARDELWGEMQLAKKIQTILLPENPSIPGYAISAYMAPAAEVGGDYYDIINVEGKDWLVIGDVSGHGIPAGLIMMMVQTSIQVTLSQHPALEPSKLLKIINGTITRNIHKLGEDKYMTITCLAVHEQGRFTFSGLHQNILIYRKKSGKVESFESRGLWLGIFDSIENMMFDDCLSLDIGDVMLLYTDGITEAWIKNRGSGPRDSEKDMFGEERLSDIISARGESSPDMIKNSIIENLKDYQLRDDVTMVIVKRTV